MVSRINLSTLEEVDALNMPFLNSYYYWEHPAGFISGDYCYVVYNDDSGYVTNWVNQKTSVGRFKLPSN